MGSIRIIGVGSPSSSDNLALLAIEKLEQMGWQSEYPQHQIAMEKIERPGPALLDCMQEADLAIVIDALISSHAPGEVVPLTPNDISQDEWVLSGNSLGVAETIALGSVLGELPDNLIIMGLTTNQESGVSSVGVDINSAIVASLQQLIASSIELVE
jgi:hydrogenase maturation protease